MTIPRVAESDDQRRRKIYEQQIEDLERRLEETRPLRDAAEDKVINTAFAFVIQMQRSLAPQVFHGPFDSTDVLARPITVEEQMALGSACDLIADYFDRHNSRLPRRNLTP